MEQTALQQAIKQLINFKSFPMVDIPTIEAAISFCEAYLEVEKQQIKEAYQDGAEDQHDPDKFKFVSEDYYNSKYGK